ncbi:MULTISPECIES: hypothetical protein [Methylocaldum]|jgi:hypothetical protein|nr:MULTISPECIES: hypothetical protein [unclassified Methylocaldum]MBP1152330.1 hypothetical protein [Methylocaldum sp. RMAD-M]
MMRDKAVELAFEAGRTMWHAPVSAISGRFIASASADRRFETV